MAPGQGDQAFWVDAAATQSCRDLAEPRDMDGDTAPGSVPEL